MRVLFSHTYLRLLLTLSLGVLFFVPLDTYAATLNISPATGVYKTGQTFTVQVVVNTAGTPVNASDGTITFNPRELSVVAVGRTNSIFNLWTSEPAFSNTAGTITYSGGVPTGYTGGAGSVISITFRSLTSGSTRVSISGGSVLAADGRGTNALQAMNGGTYTLAAVEAQPAPEVIIDYVPPANTPSAPKISSDTHSDPSLWYTNKNAELRWTLPSDVTAVRTSLDATSLSVPTKVYESPISKITLSDLDQGVSYFHLQFKNKDGWGKITHYRLAIDSEKPTSFVVSSPDATDFSNPIQVVQAVVEDASSPIVRIKMQIDSGEPFDYTPTSSASLITLPALTPGQHTVLAEAFDSAGNSILATYAFAVTAFDKPVITEYPSELSAGVIPVIRGTTKPNALVTITLTPPSGTVETATTTSDASGQFTFIPSSSFSVGVYSVSAVATDATGATSAPSDVVKIVVSEPGYMVIGSMLINVLSLIIPLIALAVFGWLVLVYSLHRVRLLRSRISRESAEATAMAKHEFAAIKEVLARHEEMLIQSRKTKKLTEAEAALIADIKAVVATAETRVEKEVADVAALIEPQ